MFDPIASQLSDMFPHTCTITTIAPDGTGGFSVLADPAPFTVDARVRGVEEQVVDAMTGREVTSNVKGTLNYQGATVLDPRIHRFTIPSTFTPNSLLEAKRIDPVYDENGSAVHHWKVWI